MTTLRRFARFNAVAFLGMAVQLAALEILVTGGVHYVIATLAGVSAAIVHNFIWHRRWTWAVGTDGRRRRASAFAEASADRRSLARSRLARRDAGRQFVEFAMANGTVSVIGNLVLMPVFVSVLGIPILVANLLAIAVCGGVNFCLADAIFTGGLRPTD